MVKNMVVTAVFLTAFTVSAIFASTAFAEDEWLLNGETAVTEPVLITGKLELTDNKVPLVGASTVECDFTGIGEISVGREEIMEIFDSEEGELGLNLVGEGLLCKALKGCEKPVEEDTEVWPEHLIWEGLIELMMVGPMFLQHLFGNEGREPGWEVLCLVFGMSVSETCTGLTSVELKNEGEFVRGNFSPAAPIESQKVNCELGGANSGEIHGWVTTEPLAGGELKVE
jgi:hypothetical protein